MMTFDLIQALINKKDFEILEELGPSEGAFATLRMVRTLRGSMQETPIEVIASAAIASGVTIDNILVPEQCFEMWLPNGKHYQVSISEIQEESDTVHGYFNPVNV